MHQNNPEHKKIAEEIFLAGVESVMPSKLIKEFVKPAENGLYIDGVLFPYASVKNIYVVGAGKASGAMAAAVEEIAGDRITGGTVVVKYGHTFPCRRIRIVEAGHPVPDHNGFLAAREIVEIAGKAGPDDLVLCLFSGGGSSLLSDYPEGACEEDMIKMNDLLVKCGATISEINTVRKHLSLIKGGQLARAAYPAKVINLILSDVPGDDPGVIASGPTAPDNTTFGNAMEVILKYHLKEKMPQNLIRYLERGVSGEIPQNPPEGDPVFENVRNIITGNNRKALAGASVKAGELGCECVIYEDSLFMDVEAAAKLITGKALMHKKNKPAEKPLCLLFGGETTLAVHGSGMGGRNQHLALLCAKMLRHDEGITVLCGGTDGTDGPTGAAGAVIDCRTWTDAIMNRIDPCSYLERFDSFNFFREAGGHLITGPTYTNVMDIAVVII